MNGLANAKPANTIQLSPDRRALHVPAAARRQPDGAAAVAALRCDRPLRERAVHDRRRDPGHGHDVPAPGVFAANGVPERHGPARRLHSRHRAPLLPGAVPARQRQAGPLRAGQRRGGPRDGALRHEEAADLRLPAPEAPSGLRDRRRLLPGGVRRLVPQPPVADRGATPVYPGAPAALHSILDVNGFPNKTYPLLHAAAGRDDRQRRRGHRDVPRAARARLRRLRRQHDPADVSAARGRCSAAAADRRRRSATSSAPRASAGPGTRAAGRTPTA